MREADAALQTSVRGIIEIRSDFRLALVMLLLKAICMTAGADGCENKACLQRQPD